MRLDKRPEDRRTRARQTLATSTDRERDVKPSPNNGKPRQALEPVVKVAGQGVAQYRGHWHERERTTNSLTLVCISWLGSAPLLPPLSSMSSSTAVDASKIGGNASIETKEALADVPLFYGIYTGSVHKGPIFAEDIHDRLRVTEISINKKAEEPNKLEGRVVQELTVEEGEYL